MAKSEEELQRMGQEWCDLGKYARNNVLDILAGTKTTAQCNARWQPRIEVFLKNLAEYNGLGNTEESLKEIREKAARIDAAHRAKYRK